MHFTALCGRRAAESDLGGEEFVAIDSRRHAAPFGMRVDAKNVAVAVDPDVAGQGDFFGQGQHEFNARARFEISLGSEIKSPEADVPRVALTLAGA